ncbi:hypothetical protein VNI00_014850 [Paramarasmius palmivorus]|uniref:Rhodopsin domain-containing protein n=1 Tax=Paramarasmius palmivorus TaxID=297713 RepID=A0AAW0BQL1_9AGAR
MVSVTNLRIITTVLFGVAQLTTYARAILRYRRHRFWVDDGVALLATICSLVGLVCFWVDSDVEGIGPFVQSEASRIRASWVVNGMFISVLWSSRLAILLSLIRVLPYRLRSIPYAVCCLFMMMWAAILALTVKMCEPSAEWWKVNHHCQDRVTLMTTLSFEFFSALFLVLAPAVLSAKLPEDIPALQQGIVSSVAVVGLFLLGGSIAHGIFFVQHNGDLEQLTACIQVATTLLFTNIPALVVFASGSHGRNLDKPSHTGSISPSGPGKFSVESMKASIGFPRPLSARSSTPLTDKSATPEPSPYHLSFFPPVSSEKRQQTALLLGLPIDSERRDIPGSPSIYSDENTADTHRATLPIANKFARDLTPTTPHSETLYSRDSIHDYPFINEPPDAYTAVDQTPRVPSWLSNQSSILDQYHQALTPAPETPGSGRSTIVDRTPLLPEAKAVRFLSPLVTEAYTPPASDTNSSTYSTSSASTPISKYLAEEDPFSSQTIGAAVIDVQPGVAIELAMPKPAWLCGPEPQRISQVQPF